MTNGFKKVISRRPSPGFNLSSLIMELSINFGKTPYIQDWKLNLRRPLRDIEMMELDALIQQLWTAFLTAMVGGHHNLAKGKNKCSLVWSFFTSLIEVLNSSYFPHRAIWRIAAPLKTVFCVGGVFGWAEYIRQSKEAELTYGLISIIMPNV